MNNQSVGKGVKPMKAQLKVQKLMPLICELFNMFLLNPPNIRLTNIRLKMNRLLGKFCSETLMPHYTHCFFHILPLQVTH